MNVEWEQASQSGLTCSAAASQRWCGSGADVQPGGWETTAFNRCAKAGWTLQANGLPLRAVGWE